MSHAVVSYSSETTRHTATFTAELRELAEGAAAAATAVGLDVRWVNASERRADAEAHAAALVDAAGGVIVLGGADVDPEMYGEAPTGSHLDSADIEADRFEAALMRRAIATGKPVFAICRGAQLLNVAQGGTLVQDLGVGTHTGDDPSMLDHDVAVVPGTRLAGIVGAGSHGIRSSHHQCVKRAGAGLIVSATAPDGVIEAIEAPGSAWIVGVQWHPEDPGADPAMMRALLEDFSRHLVG